ncbi:MAG TPA: hypothetical protein VNZ45_13590 [Bacteroidia bacterium]|nr:hypothetical protein [Bacteroidia bacterium]
MKIGSGHPPDPIWGNNPTAIQDLMAITFSPGVVTWAINQRKESLPVFGFVDK